MSQACPSLAADDPRRRVDLLSLLPSLSLSPSLFTPSTLQVPPSTYKMARGNQFRLSALDRVDARPTLFSLLSYGRWSIDWPIDRSPACRDGLNFKGKTTRPCHGVPVRGAIRYLLCLIARARVPLECLQRDFEWGPEAHPGGAANLAL